MMSDIYEANAPVAFPAPQEQPDLGEDIPGGRGPEKSAGKRNR